MMVAAQNYAIGAATQVVGMKKRKMVEKKWE
jgi:hypothetical protein